MVGPLPNQAGRMLGLRYVLLVKYAGRSVATTTIHDTEGPAREAWRTAAVCAAAHLPFGGRTVEWARLYSGRATGSRHDAHRLAAGGHLRMLETSHPLTAPAEQERERSSIICSV
jgi:hypothetical protein